MTTKMGERSFWVFMATPIIVAMLLILGLLVCTVNIVEGWFLTTFLIFVIISSSMLTGSWILKYVVPKPQNEI